MPPGKKILPFNVMNGLKYILITLCLSAGNMAFANLPYQPLQFELTTSTPVIEEDGTIHFRLRITNADKDSTYPVMIPGPTNSGRKLLYMTAYTVNDKNFYTEVAREWPDDQPASSGYSSGDVRVVQLKPGAHIDIPFRFYSWPHDKKNPAERHWFSKPLKAGAYQFLVWYHPYGNVPFDLYHYTDGFHDDYPGTKLSFDKHRNPSGYCKITIQKRDSSKIIYGVAEHCKTNCGFCEHIKKRDWERVRDEIDATVKTINRRRPGPIGGITTDVAWLRKHKNVAYLSAPPEAILSSLPTYWSQKVGFKSGDTIMYFGMTFQIGKVYPGRSRIQTLMYSLFSIDRPAIKTSDENYVGLKYFTPASKK